MHIVCLDQCDGGWGGNRYFNLAQIVKFANLKNNNGVIIIKYTQFIGGLIKGVILFREQIVHHCLKQYLIWARTT